MKGRSLCACPNARELEYFLYFLRHLHSINRVCAVLNIWAWGPLSLLTLVADLTPELVTQYLQQNPEFLEHHVTAYVNTEQIERWLQRKTNVSSRAGNRYRLDHHTLNGRSVTLFACPPMKCHVVSCHVRMFCSSHHVSVLLWNVDIFQCHEHFPCTHHLCVFINIIHTSSTLTNMFGIQCVCLMSLRPFCPTECQGCVPCKTLRHDTVSLTGEVTTEARTSSLSKWKVCSFSPRLWLHL